MCKSAGSLKSRFLFDRANRQRRTESLILRFNFLETQMAMQPKNAGKQWTPPEVKQLKELAKGNTPTRVIGLKLDRSESSVRSKARSERVSLKPTNQSPYGTNKKK